MILIQKKATLLLVATLLIAVACRPVLPIPLAEVQVENTETPIEKVSEVFSDALTEELEATKIPKRKMNPGDWELHTISDHYGGPDGVKLVDVNGDGWMDITTAYEWNGDLLLFLHPGRKKVEDAWPAIQIGNVARGEDALAIDLNDDGNMDVISAHEGDQMILAVHWAPEDAQDYARGEKWEEEFIWSSKEHSWMFVIPMDINEDGKMDVVAGAKDDRGQGRNAVGELAWLENPGDDGSWGYNRIGKLYWPMSILPFDVDQDGDLDLLVSDRRNAEGRQGMRWFENPGKNWGEIWDDHYVANLIGLESFFISMGDLDGDGAPELVIPIEKPLSIMVVSMAKALSDASPGEAIQLKYTEDFGEAHFKSVAVGDIDLDGYGEIVVTLVNGEQGVGYFDNPAGKINKSWVWVPILGGLDNPKFDLAQLYDMDGDGDLDIVTSEDVYGLGVIWLENPFAGAGK